MPLEIKRTPRGFPFVEFDDQYGKRLGLQVSSLADRECVWLNDAHLSRADVARLLPYLQAFVEHGYNFLDTPIADHPELAELEQHERD